MKPILFSGRSCPELTKKISEHNRLEFGKLEILTFANSEIKVRVLSEVADRETVVVQATANPTNDNLMELLFMVDALGRQNAQSITLIVPYFGYARQNLQHQSGECVSLNVVVKMLESLKVNKIITVDIHDEASSGIFSIPFENLTALPYLAKTIYRKLKLNKDKEQDFVIGSPDQGGVERARTFAESFYQNKANTDTVVVEKKRNLAKAHESKAVEVFGNVKNKQVILVDDIVTSANTIINAAEMCLSQGAESVSVIVVHPDFARSTPAKIQQSQLKRFFTTNTIEKPIENLALYPKIEVLEITPVLQF